MAVHGAFNSMPAAPGSSRGVTTTPCKRTCCWTPYGHSTARDSYPPGNMLACVCHNTKESTR